MPKKPVEDSFEVLTAAEIDIGHAEPPELVKLDKSVPCGICLGSIKTGLMAIKCKCGKLYHESCGVRVGECPKCSRKFNLEKMAKLEEDELDELEEMEELELTKEEYEQKKDEEDKKERKKFAAKLEKLEDRLVDGDISEETYLMLREKFEKKMK